jgi:hypothetical protein
MDFHFFFIVRPLEIVLQSEFVARSVSRRLEEGNPPSANPSKARARTSQMIGGGLLQHDKREEYIGAPQPAQPLRPIQENELDIVDVLLAKAFGRRGQVRRGYVKGEDALVPTGEKTPSFVHTS